MNSLPLLRQRLLCDDNIPRHRHRSAYAAVVLAGRYLEASQLGRRWLGPGDVAVHAPFAAHLNRIGAAGACILNLPVTSFNGPADTFGRVTDPDAIAMLARHNAADVIWTRANHVLLPISRDILHEAARLRANISGLKTPDAIHAATALLHGCTLFVSNDVGFRRVPNLPLVLLDDIVATP